MKPLNEFLRGADACSLLFLVVILYFAGQKIIASHPRLQPCGWRLAAAAFVLYLHSSS